MTPSGTSGLPIEIRHFHLFCGLGAGARGFNRGEARLGNLRAAFRCLGGVDSDPAAIRDFGRLAGVPGTILDLFDREQYAAFHGQEPPAGWREAIPEDLRRAASGERPHIVFLSAPCKGFSGLMSEARSQTARYQALNGLTLRGVWLMCEAWADDPPEFVLFENVPRIATRGRPLVDRIVAILRHYGYATAETTHDCGELGNLAQSRKRWLLVCRHTAKVPPFLYEPPKRALRAVGDVLGRMPLPGHPAAGPMHRIPALQWRTWVRLAFVEAGSDWRSLNKLRVAGGVLQDYAIEPDAGWHRGNYGVLPWSSHAGTVKGRSFPSNGSFSVADPRFDARGEYGQLGVQGWDETASTIRHVKSPIQGRFSVADPRRPEGRAEFGQYGVAEWGETGQTVIGKAAVGAGRFAVADPRHAGPAKHCNEFRIVPWSAASGAVTSAHGSGQCVQDPRYLEWHPEASSAKLRVTDWETSAFTVTGSQQVASGALSVADPRAGLDPGRAYAAGGHYGVVGWNDASPAVRGAAKVANSPGSVADPRAALPGVEERLVAVIRALDGTWHRPFTTLELAALQSIVDPEEQLELDGLSDAAWRERIGNAVPPAAATAIAGVMGTTLLLAWSGEGFALSNVPIWVRPVAVALAVQAAEVAP